VRGSLLGDTMLFKRRQVGTLPLIRTIVSRSRWRNRGASCSNSCIKPL